MSGGMGFSSCVKMEGFTWEALMVGFGCKWFGKDPIPPAEKETRNVTHIFSLDASSCQLDVGMSHMY